MFSIFHFSIPSFYTRPLSLTWRLSSISTRAPATTTISITSTDSDNLRDTPPQLRQLRHFTTTRHRSCYSAVTLPVSRHFEYSSRSRLRCHAQVPYSRVLWYLLYCVFHCSVRWQSQTEIRVYGRQALSIKTQSRNRKIMTSLFIWRTHKN